MNDMQIFNNPEFGSVRTIQEDGKIFFCGNDIATALGYSNTRDDMRQHCKGALKRDTLTSGGEQQLLFMERGAA